jgi:hypothetical protein
MQLLAPLLLLLRFLLLLDRGTLSRDQLTQRQTVISNRGVQAANTSGIDEQLIKHPQADAQLLGQLEPGGVTVQLFAHPAADASKLGQVLAMAARDGDDPTLGIHPVVD